MAAGCTIAGEDFDAFRAACARGRTGEAAGRGNAGAHAPQRRAARRFAFRRRHARLLDAQVWGAASDAPVFCDAVEVVSQRSAARST
jgi:single-stranded-DNA-specific exonuclease